MTETNEHYARLIFDGQEWSIVGLPKFGDEQWLTLEALYEVAGVRTIDRMCIPLSWVVQKSVKEKL